MCCMFVFIPDKKFENRPKSCDFARITALYQSHVSRLLLEDWFVFEF